MPFVDDLDRELHRAAKARERKPRRAWSARLVPVLAPAGALAAAAIALAVLAGGLTGGPDREQATRDGARVTPQRLAGSYERRVRAEEWKGRWELLVRDGSARLLGIASGAAVSFDAGKLTFRGDEVTFRVDIANANGDPWPEPICARRRRDTPGTYRITEGAGGSFTLRALRDPCRGRAAILAGGEWRWPAVGDAAP